VIAAAPAGGAAAHALAGLRRHIAFALLLLVAGAAMVAFAWQRSIATIGDDSVSYLLLAQHIAPDTPPMVERWVGLRAHFAPLFPLALALTGGAHDLLVAHWVVAACGILALVAVYAFALLRLGSRLGAFAVAAIFLATPNAWVSLKGILSEPMFLMVSLAALAWYSRRLEARAGSTGDWLAFGVLLAAAYLTRAAGVSLLIAYAVHAGLRAARERGRGAAWRLVLPALPLAALVGFWLAWRPETGVDLYGFMTRQLLAGWIGHPAAAAQLAVERFVGGWIASFLAQSSVGIASRVAFALLGILAVAGSVRAAWRNRLDGWYVLVSLGITFGWVFTEDNTRRLFYPLLPLLMIHAAELVRAMAARLSRPRLRAWSIAGVALLPLLLCLPADIVLVEKRLDDAPYAPGANLAYADCVDFYTTIGIEPARAYAADVLGMLEGFEAIARATPPNARIMWVRPEYVALLGHRESVPYFFAWDERRLARELLRQRVDYLVVGALYKSDYENRVGDPYRLHPRVTQYTTPVVRIRNAVTGRPAFVLARVDPAGVERFLASAATEDLTAAAPRK